MGVWSWSLESPKERLGVFARRIRVMMGDKSRIELWYDLWRGDLSS